MSIPSQLTTAAFQYTPTGGVFFDNGLIQSDGNGNLIANSFLGIGASGALPVANVIGYGADPTGVNDSTAAWNNAIADLARHGGGIPYGPPGVYSLLGQIAINSPSIYMMGAGPATIIQPMAGFAGSGKIINITADFCGVSNLQINGGPSTTIASNPATDAIRCSKRWARLENLFFFYVNGWCMNILAGPGTNCAGVMMNRIYGEHVLQGIHSLSADANFTGQQFLSNCHFERVDGGDGIFLEDVSDFFMSNVVSACTQATGVGSPLHIKGHCQTIKGVAIEPGMFSGNPSSDCVLIESGTNGSPADVTLSGGEILDGQIGIHITAGKQIIIDGFKIGSNNTSAVVNNGGTSVKINHCITTNDGQQGTTGRYAFENLAGDMTVHNCEVQEAQGTTAGKLNNAYHAGGGSLYVEGGALTGSGWTAANAFSGVPGVARGVRGYNPVGAFTPPAVPASTTPLTNPFGVDSTVIVSGGTVTVISIGGTTTGLTSGSFRVPANQTIAITYSVAPTWQWFGD